MLTPRESFAYTAVPKSGEIVAGGGSRHILFSATGSRTSSVKRAVCVGFFVGDGKKMKFWVMGGYSESRTISGVFPVDEHYRDAVVMELKNGNGGCKWREVGDMWEAGERMRLSKNVVVEDGDDCGRPSFSCLITMLYSGNFCF
ncbi:hypothetical protein EV1_004079 [Malus domestica]